MNQIMLFLIYLMVALVGVVCTFILLKTDRKGMFKFVVWFSCTLVASFFVLDLVSNPFTLSLIIASVVAFVAVKDGD